MNRFESVRTLSRTSDRSLESIGLLPIDQISYDSQVLDEI